MGTLATHVNEVVGPPEGPATNITPGSWGQMKTSLSAPSRGYQSLFSPLLALVWPASTQWTGLLPPSGEACFHTVDRQRATF